MAAVLGGAQSLHTNSRDEALALPTEESARLALRTQQIIAAESGVTNTVDPVGGSEVIERLTDSIERGAQVYLDRIDAMGGALRAIESRYIQNEIQNAAFVYQKTVESGEQVVVGVNRFRRSGSIRRSNGHRSNGCAKCAPRAGRRKSSRPSSGWKTPPAELRICSPSSSTQPRGTQPLVRSQTG
jgi:methylmalonyl-CoA mutase N-terminal domain/subunit